MAKLKVELGDRSYPINIGVGQMTKIGEEVKKTAKGRKVAVVTNPKVAKLYLSRCKASLKKAGLSVFVITLPDGERYKRLSQIEKVYNALLKAGFDRSDSIVALGGGVTGDMAGFAAATYMRGIDYAQVPTTLLAMVDSSVGGKTGVDHASGKNLIGSFYQPRSVNIDLAALGSLPEREFFCGMAEVIKYGVIWDEKLFRFLEKNHEAVRAKDEKALTKIIRRSCAIKAEVVAMDEREGGIRAILNMGHTFGHGIETALGFKRLKHGEAIAIGMMMAARLSSQMRFCDEDCERRLQRLLRLYSLPVKLPRQLTAEEVIDGMRHDKKVTAGKNRFVLMSCIGKATIQNDLPYKEVAKAIIGRV